MPNRSAQPLAGQNIPPCEQNAPASRTGRDNSDRIYTVSNGRTEGRDAASGRFTAGNSGRPRGARNRTTLLAEVLSPDEAATILRDMVDDALAGDADARRLCFERLAPRRRDALVTFDLPDIATPEDAVRAANTIPALVADGILAPSEGALLHHIIERSRVGLRSRELEAAHAAREARDHEKRQEMLRALFAKAGWPGPPGEE